MRERKEREAKQEIRRQARTLPQVSLGQGCQMRGKAENMDGGMGFYSTGLTNQTLTDVNPIRFEIGPEFEVRIECHSYYYTGSPFQVAVGSFSE